MCPELFLGDKEETGLKTNEFMNHVHALVVENGAFAKAEKILDYFLPAELDTHEICSADICSKAIVGFGGSEGIYIDCYLEGCIASDKSYARVSCGTYKTLDESMKAMQIMGELVGSLTYYANSFICAHYNELQGESREGR